MNTKKIKKEMIKMSTKDSRNSLMGCLMNRRVVVSVLVAVFVMVSLASPAIGQASSDAVLIMHFDEGSGSVVKDSSGNGNDGTIHGAQWVDGKYGKALEFDGKADYVESSLNSVLNSDLTIEFWMKSDYSASDQQRMVDLGTSGSRGFQLCMFTNGNLMIDNSGGPSSTVSTSSSYNDGIWHHITGVRKGSNYYLYVDGSYIDSTTGAIPSYNYLHIAKIAENWGYFNGIIDEVKIYNRALTADEIKEYYERKQTELTLTKSASPSTIQEGETTTISIRVENTGTGDAKSVEVTDTISTGFKIISGSKSASFDEIKPGDYRTSEYTLKATGSGKFTCDPATATYKDADGNSYSAASNSVSIQVGGEVPVGADSDGDGWSDEKEREMGTNPYSVDSDGDGLKDPEDPNPTVPEEKKTPGFEAVFAVAGLLAVAYLLRRRG
jgi:PGF-CTERM protein/uncharacterized repeat protein (TIGR01451 family)